MYQPICLICYVGPSGGDSARGSGRYPLLDLCVWCCVSVPANNSVLYNIYLFHSTYKIYIKHLSPALFMLSLLAFKLRSGSDSTV